MADQLDNHPVFTIVMGCNGAGKSAWKRENYDRLSEHYFDQDSIAGGIGDWNSESARARTREYVDDQIDQAMAARRDFGIESTYSWRPGRAMVERAKAASYRVEGVYIGTDSPEINAERIDHRVKTNTGHHVDVERLPERYRFSLSNIRKTAELLRRPRGGRQLRPRRGAAPVPQGPNLHGERGGALEGRTDAALVRGLARALRKIALRPPTPGGARRAPAEEGAGPPAPEPRLPRRGRTGPLGRNRRRQERGRPGGRGRRTGGAGRARRTGAGRRRRTRGVRALGRGRDRKPVTG